MFYFNQKVYRLFVVVLFFSLFSAHMNAQVIDTVKQSQAPIVPTPAPVPVMEHSPKRAALMSAIIPGAGQIYNKKYWKVPIIYAGAIGLGYSLNFNQSKFTNYRKAYIARVDGDPNTVDNYPKYSDDNLSTLMKFYERYRNLTVIGCTLLYVMNVIDASVDAHLFTFNVGDDDLSFHVQPTLINTGYSSLPRYSTGLSLNVRF